ncbi:uncharacterized protein G2W53_014856 [Senna tora]|uniref:Uncharacterized protein n=1 Tax=Senna tora TaxID=362788 RepID=A0A834WU06_9FABA|nr:uncharacterized protein G2W53_014856 [Senna tora]
MTALKSSLLLVELLLLMLNIPQYDFNLKVLSNFIADSQHSTVRFQSQSSVIATINSSNISPIYQSTRIFTGVEQEISLTYLQIKHFLFHGGGGFFSFTLPKHFCVFSDKIYCNETTAPRDLSGGNGFSFDDESSCR